MLNYVAINDVLIQILNIHSLLHFTVNFYIHNIKIGLFFKLINFDKSEYMYALYILSYLLNFIYKYKLFIYRYSINYRNLILIVSKLNIQP